MGVPEGHCELVVQFTQTLDALKTVFVGSLVHVTGTAGVFELHSAHAPVPRQAGLASEHGNLFAGPTVVPKLPVQPVQVFRSISHEPFVGWSAQAVALPSLHSRQAPNRHAGVVGL